MAAPGRPIAHEFRTDRPPEVEIREVFLRAEEFGRLGYRVESHAAEVVVMSRRFTPSLAYEVPLGIAALAFIVPILMPGGTVADSALGGRIALIAVIASVVLALVVKTTERVTFSAGAAEGGSRILVSGSATPALRRYLRSRWNEPEVSAGEVR